MRVNVRGGMVLLGAAMVIAAGPASSAAQAVQAPGGLFVSQVTGNTVTLRWDPPLGGPAPDGYVLEGGVTPGSVLASVPTGLSAPIFTFVAPTGSFFVRVHSLLGAARSGPSNEVPLHVNVAVPAAIAGEPDRARERNVARAHVVEQLHRRPAGVAAAGRLRGPERDAALAPRRHLFIRRRPARHLHLPASRGQCRRRQRVVQSGDTHVSGDPARDRPRRQRRSPRMPPVTPCRACGARPCRDLRHRASSST